MTHYRKILCIVSLLVTAAVVSPKPALAQDALTRARDLYESAEYEQALQLLGTLRDKAASSEASAYQVFCLVALGRQDEAKTAVTNLVRKDPLYRPSDAQVSPRLRAFFDDIRRPLLPEVTRATYARAKAAFDKKDWSTASDEFGRVIAVLDEQSPTDEGARDLRTLASGFRDLADAARALPPAGPAATPTPTPAPIPTSAPASASSTTTNAPVSSPSAPPASPATSPSPTTGERTIYGEQDTSVIRPVPISRQLPGWFPNGVERQLTFAGVIELVVSEEGKVLSATVEKSVNTRYDALLLDAAKSWTFKPATRNGAPVKFRYQMAVNLTPKL